MPKRQHMEQMTVGMTSYLRSISKLQASTSATPAPSELSPVGSVILVECWRLQDQLKVELQSICAEWVTVREEEESVSRKEKSMKVWLTFEKALL